MTLYRLGSCRAENIYSKQWFCRPISCYRCHPPNTFLSGRVQLPNRERLGPPENFEAQGLCAHVARRAWAPAPRPKSTPLMSTRSCASLRHKFRGDPRSRTGLQSGQKRDGAERPVIKLYINVFKELLSPVLMLREGVKGLRG